MINVNVYFEVLFVVTDVTYHDGYGGKNICIQSLALDLPPPFCMKNCMDNPMET